MRRFVFPLLLACFLLTAGRPAAMAYETPPQAGDPVQDIGTFVPLGNGLRLQLLLVDKAVVAYFIDAGDLILPAPADSILLVIDQPGHPSDEWRSVLSPDGPVKLASPRRLYGPSQFRARLIIRFTDAPPSSFTNVPLNLEKNM